MATQRACRICGCTNDHACFDEILGQPCSWADEDTCTVCARIELAISRLRLSRHGRAVLESLSMLLACGPFSEADQQCVFVLLRAAWGTHAGVFRFLIHTAAADPCRRQ